jgi:hypothetical protein
VTETMRTTLHVCNKHSVGVPYPFTTVITDNHWRLKDYLWVAWMAIVGFVSLACFTRGAWEFAQDIWRIL